MTPGTEGDVNTTLPLLLSFACTLVFCNPLVGLPAIVLAIQARSARNMGSLDLARKRARAALVLSIAGMGLGLLLEVVELVRWLGS
jgi:hypothetical protein